MNAGLEAFCIVGGLLLFLVLMAPWLGVICLGILGFPIRLIDRYWNWAAKIIEDREVGNETAKRNARR